MVASVLDKAKAGETSSNILENSTYVYSRVRKVQRTQTFQYLSKAKLDHIDTHPNYLRPPPNFPPQQQPN